MEGVTQRGGLAEPVSPGAPSSDAGVPRAPAYRVLGVDVNASTVEDLYATVQRAVETGGRRVIGHHNLHSIYLYHHDAGMRGFYARADHVFIDGLWIVLLGRLLGLPLRREHRMTSVDWLRPLLARAAERGWRVFCLGSRPGVGEAAAQVLRAELPALQIQVAHGYFDARRESEENAAVLAQIRSYRPDLLLVGMGMPRQEHWIAQELDRLDVPVVMSLGAFLDYPAGAVPTPPRWMSRLGLEWLARLVAEPGRLWRRYLAEPWALLPLFLEEWIRTRAVVRVLRARRAARAGPPVAGGPQAPGPEGVVRMRRGR